MCELVNQVENLKEENSILKSENLSLPSENKDLIERTNNLSYILADLQGKAKTAEEERDSMITAMRLLVLESSAENKGNPLIDMQNCDNQSKTNEADDCTIQTTQDVLNFNAQVKNKFSTLDDQLIETSNPSTSEASQQQAKANKS
jgi:hypothetical protein